MWEMVGETSVHLLSQCPFVITVHSRIQIHIYYTEYSDREMSLSRDDFVLQVYIIYTYTYIYERTCPLF